MLSPSKESWVEDLEAVLLDFCRQRKLLVGSENVVNPSVGSTEENSSWNRKICRDLPTNGNRSYYSFALEKLHPGDRRKWTTTFWYKNTAFTTRSLMNTQHSYAKEKTSKHWELFNFPAKLASKRKQDGRPQPSTWIFSANSYLLYKPPRTAMKSGVPKNSHYSSELLLLLLYATFSTRQLFFPKWHFV